MTMYQIHSDKYYYIPRQSTVYYKLINGKYQCPKCPKSYKNKAHCTTHHTNIHLRKLKCPDKECTYKCGSLNNMRQHYGRKHCGTKKNRIYWVKINKKKFICKKCNEEYKNEPQIAGHIVACNKFIIGIKDLESRKNNIGTREEVFNNIKNNTISGLKKNDLIYKNGKYMSKKAIEVMKKNRLKNPKLKTNQERKRLKKIIKISKQIVKDLDELLKKLNQN